MNIAVNTGLVSLASVAFQLSASVCVCCSQREKCTAAGGARTLSSANRTESASLEIFVFLLGDVLGGVTTCSQIQQCNQNSTSKQAALHPNAHEPFLMDKSIADRAESGRCLGMQLQNLFNNSRNSRQQTFQRSSTIAGTSGDRRVSMHADG